MFYDQDAEDERTDRDRWGFLDAQRPDATIILPPDPEGWMTKLSPQIEPWSIYGGGGGGEMPADALTMVWDQREPDYDPDPTPQTPYMPARGPAHRSLTARRQHRMRAVVSIGIIALCLAVVALLVVPPKSRNAAKIKLNTVQTVPPTTRAPATTLPNAISPGPPVTSVTRGASTIITLPPNEQTQFQTTSGGTASNTSGAAGVPTYYVAGGGPAGNKVPTVVDGVTMPRPGQQPTAAQVRAAGTIPYVCPSRCDGINWAAIDALAGEGWGP